jgi:hypothetical protein
MRLNEVTYNDARPVEGYGPGFFRIGGEVIHGPVITGPAGTAGWGGYDDTAPLLAMGETFEEIHHRVVSNPNAGTIGDFLTEATERLSIEEELSVAAAVEVDAGMRDDVKERMARVAAKARQRQTQ